ncbi:uncharacterized protein J4E79_007427 [Alternaria viburni]|uniref:uncharacterized protein n=1 Tax=Alternaria viburni TaxID=566460 RepID=UPI0020C5A2A5|nr:uncharacterized protein J4E79_007427 [Alternaria viburni]KAI4657354.1 hypothetical protein J4E79_007427 [Alternaria viburni]
MGLSPSQLQLPHPLPDQDQSQLQRIYTGARDTVSKPGGKTNIYEKMSATHLASVYIPGQLRRLDDLPPELIVMIARSTNDASDISSLRRVNRFLSAVIPAWVISETAFYIMPTSSSISRMAQAVQTQSTNPSCNLGRVSAVIFENVWPTPPDKFGLHGELTQHDDWEADSDDELPPNSNTYLHFIDGCHEERDSAQLRDSLAHSLGNFHGVKEMIHVPGFHKSRPAQERPSSEELLQTVLLYKDHDPEDFEDEMWTRRRMMFVPYPAYLGHECTRMFDHAVDAVLRNSMRKEKLKVYIETHSIWALSDADPSAPPIPATQLGHVLAIKYVGHYMSILDAIDHDLGILHDQNINTASHYAGITHLSISGDGLGNEGSVHMGLLGGSSHSPDWSRLETLHFDDTQQNDNSADFLRQQKCTLELHNVYWLGDSIQRFSKGSSLRDVKASGIFAIEEIKGHAKGVWIVANDHREANEIVVKNAGCCKPVALGPAVPFVSPSDVQRYMVKGGVLPFSKANVWAKDWKL